MPVHNNRSAKYGAMATTPACHQLRPPLNWEERVVAAEPLSKVCEVRPQTMMQRDFVCVVVLRKEGR